MVNYKEIADAISPQKMVAALAIILPDKIKTKISNSGSGKRERTDVLDANNNPVMVAGGFATLNKVEAAYNEVKVAFPGLKLGHVQNAIHYRHVGRV